MEGLAGLTGRDLDPWFGEVAICGDAGGVEFRSAKSPKLAGAVVHQGERLLVDWHDADVDAEAWLSFARSDAGRVRLAMAKVDPDADFCYDYEDLAFERIGDCAAP